MSYVTDNVKVSVDSIMSVTCSDVITLEATLLGDLTGHTFFWEQLSGTPVTWLESVYQPSVMFQQPIVRDDKVFRFTLDRGTPFAKTGDVLVTAVPTDRYYMLPASTRSSYSISASLLDGNISIRALEPLYRPAGSQVINDTSRTVVYNSPTTSLPQTFTSPTVSLVELSLGGVNVTIAQRPLSALAGMGLIDTVSVDKLYKLVVNRRATAQETEAFSIPSSLFSTNPDVGITDSTTFGMRLLDFSSASGIDQVITRTVTGYTYDDAWSISPNQFDSSSSIIEVIARTVVQQDNSDQYLMALPVLNSSFAILENIARQRSSLG